MTALSLIRNRFRPSRSLRCGTLALVSASTPSISALATSSSRGTPRRLHRQRRPQDGPGVGRGETERWKADQTYFIDLSKSSESASPKKRRLNSFHGQRLKQPQPLFKSTMATQLWGRRWQSHRHDWFSDSHPLVEGLFVAMPHCTRPHIEIRFHVNDGEVI